MNRLPLVTLISCFCLFGCGSGNLSDAQPVSLIGPATPTSEPSSESKEPIAVTDEMAIAATISAAAYGRSWFDEQDRSFHTVNSFDSRAVGTWFAFRKWTIPVPEIPGAVDIPADLRDDFVKKNETSEKLQDDYDVKFGLKLTASTASDETVFKTELALSQRKHPDMDLKAVISISRPGFDKAHTKSLVFVRFFNPLTGPQQKFFLVSWKRDGMGIVTNGIEWF